MTTLIEALKKKFGTPAAALAALGLDAALLEEKPMTTKEAVSAARKAAMAFAEDATPEGLNVLLEALSQVKPAAVDPAAGGGGGMGDAPPEEEPTDGGGEAPPLDGPVTRESIRAFLEQELSPEAFAQFEQMLAALSDEEEAPPDDGMGGGPDEDQQQDGLDGSGPPPFDGRPRMPNEGAHDSMANVGMDEATVQKMITASTDAVRRQEKELRQAERDVRPYVGDIIGCDSAEQVYRKALAIKGVDPKQLEQIKEVPALKILLSAQKPAGAVEKKSTAEMATDGKAAKGFFERFPEAARIEHAN